MTSEGEGQGWKGRDVSVEEFLVCSFEGIWEASVGEICGGESCIKREEKAKNRSKKKVRKK